jgi:L-lactate dehydrogenase complex protein LldG
MQHNSNRAAMLAEIRRALGHRETVKPAPLEAFSDAAAEEWNEGLVARFTEQVLAVSGQVYQARTVGEVTAHIVGICQRAGARVAALSGAPLFNEMNLPSALGASGVSTRNAVDIERAGEDLIMALAQCDIGVTAADYAIAETGTLALSSDEPQALLVSLLPPIHIAVLRENQITSRLAEVISRLKTERAGRSSPCRAATFITGPSRTSDVELVLSIGVHGPKELHIIILGEGLEPKP